MLILRMAYSLYVTSLPCINKTKRRDEGPLFSLLESRCFFILHFYDGHQTKKLACDNMLKLGVSPTSSMIQQLPPPKKQTPTTLLLKQNSGRYLNHYHSITNYIVLASHTIPKNASISCYISVPPPAPLPHHLGPIVTIFAAKRQIPYRNSPAICMGI